MRLKACEKLINLRLLKRLDGGGLQFRGGGAALIA